MFNSLFVTVASILDVDMILIGDSLGTTLYEWKFKKSNAWYDEITWISSYKRVNKSITIIDMPYNTYNNNIQALSNEDHF